MNAIQGINGGHLFHQRILNTCIAIGVRLAPLAVRISPLAWALIKHLGSTPILVLGINIAETGRFCLPRFIYRLSEWSSIAFLLRVALDQESFWIPASRWNIAGKQLQIASCFSLKFPSILLTAAVTLAISLRHFIQAR